MFTSNSFGSHTIVFLRPVIVLKQNMLSQRMWLACHCSTRCSFRLLSDLIRLVYSGQAFRPHSQSSRTMPRSSLEMRGLRHFKFRCFQMSAVQGSLPSSTEQTSSSAGLWLWSLQPLWGGERFPQSRQLSGLPSISPSISLLMHAVPQKKAKRRCEVMQRLSAQTTNATRLEPRSKVDCCSITRRNHNNIGTAAQLSTITTIARHNKQCIVQRIRN